MSAAISKTEVLSSPQMASDRQILILYGSETGTAQDVAERLGREALRSHLQARVMPMDAYPIASLIHEPLVLFVASTTGAGVEPGNMRRFWRFLLRRNLPADSLSLMRFSVFGLGDSSYPKYCFAAKKLHKRLLSLGATDLFPLGLADDQHDAGVDGALEPWLAGVWSRVMQLCPLPPGLVRVPDTQLLPPKFVISTAQSQLAVVVAATAAAAAAPAGGALFSVVSPPPVEGAWCAKLLENRRLTAPDHFQDVRHLRLALYNDDINDKNDTRTRRREASGTNNTTTADTAHTNNTSACYYAPGDVAYIAPQNRTEVVDAMLGWLQADGATCVTVERRSELGPDVPAALADRCVTVRELLTTHLDIGSVPRRFFFELLAHFASAAHEAERLAELAGAAGQDELHDYCARMRRTCIEVLSDFPSTQGNIPLEYLLDLFPLLQPRAFSISSSPRAHPNEVHLTVAVVRYKTRMHLPRRGVCTSWLSQLLSDDGGGDGDGITTTTVPIWLRRGTFHWPPPTTPLILVGPGTGVAPFRALLHERAAAAAAADNGDRDGGVDAASAPAAAAAAETLLFFGCRSRHGDFLYADEWDDLEARGTVRVFTAFSRDQAAKVYVQHRIREQAALVWSLLSRGAYCFVAGSANRMPDDVLDALVDVTAQEGGMDTDNARSLITRLETEGRIQRETWS